MKIINASFFIKEDKRETFLSDIKALIESTRLEKGCLQYHLYESLEETNHFMMVENWENQEAMDEHGKNPLLQRLFKDIPEYSSKAPELKVSEVIE
ncbi:antibiotic biosynthesis monooxygenase [Marinilactibacillus sp. 15R]|uniref:putative quinol monooxygenase n=1 Tax=Marinilactibacillus sp. 15R TaxID=1911586 RepID=UPI00090CD1FD|nr:putative quinol monooxygenase [Marinilactibacillus sp. 15R]API88098.1 antibiotic biosynthesis monooxygenase [Marinilactibacillus sp. 15R]